MPAGRQCNQRPVPEDPQALAEAAPVTDHVTADATHTARRTNDALRRAVLSTGGGIALELARVWILILVGTRTASASNQEA